MGEPPVFAVARDKIVRARREMRRLATYLGVYDRARLDDIWSRTATIAFAVHGAYTGLEDVMTDIARTIDDHVPQGATSHQALLDQLHVALDGRRPALLGDELYAQLVELKSFRHLVRHQYGVDLRPDKTEAKLALMTAALLSFEVAVDRLEAALSKPAQDALDRPSDL